MNPSLMPLMAAQSAINNNNNGGGFDQSDLYTLYGILIIATIWLIISTILIIIKFKKRTKKLYDPNSFFDWCLEYHIIYSALSVVVIAIYLILGLISLGGIVSNWVFN